MNFKESHVRDLLDAAPDATVVADSQGVIVFANAQVRQVLGYEPDMLIGLNVDELLPERLRGTHSDHRADFMSAPRVRPMGAGLDLYGRRRDGSEFPIEISLSPVSTDQGLLVISSIRDVTERRAFEVELSAAKDTAERATATKSRFLAAASHDLRQPLQSIAIYLDVLNRIVRQDQDKALEVSGKIDKSLDVMRELLDALLDVSKLDSGSIIPEVRDFRLQTLFDELAADCTPEAEGKGLVLRIEPTQAVVRTDLPLLHRILANFVGNAVRYTEKGSVTVSATGDGDQLRIEVRDTGIGIPEEAIETIFEEYFQLDNPVRDRRKGLGLGLSIVKQIAGLLDCTLEVSSTLGEGSSFGIRVPAGQLPEEELTQGQDQVGEPGSGEPIILFVDDDPAIVDATTMMLELAGISVRSALDGDAAIAMLEEGLTPDMVVSDYRLPGANGIEVIRRARELRGSYLPTVLMTGDTSGKVIDEAAVSNCTVLRKPVDTELLINLIEQGLDGQRGGAAAQPTG
ncbi:MAG: PAS domain S-box protein [Pseudomonadales bacterium]|nr:PAS domain S-box protein [Pseudomonadales bacterium]NIX07483.1 PAS domain S-box protein [Pseudomonadales bacterium]